MKAYVFEDISVGSGWTASFHLKVFDKEPKCCAYWAAHDDGFRSVINTDGGCSVVQAPQDEEVIDDTDAAINMDAYLMEIVEMKIAWFIRCNCPTAEQAEALSSKLRVERDLRARTKKETP